MKELSPFLLDKTEYKRNINPLKQYFEQAAHYLAINNNVSYEEALDWVKANVQPRKKDEVKPLSYYDPIVIYVGKDQHGDREIQQTTLNRYLYDTVKNEHLISPTLTTYKNPKQERSHLVQFIDSKIKERGVAKKAMFAADIKRQAEPDVMAHHIEYNIQNNKQSNAKVDNNSASGAAVIPSNPIYNPSMHPTLTSTCRSASGYANANNEKLLMGNRHYWSPDIVLNNIVSIITNVDINMVNACIVRFKLHIPTPDQVMKAILKSSRQYWMDVSKEQQIYELVKNLNDEQRAAFLYVGDFYHIAMYNEAFMRNLILMMSKKCDIEKGIKVDDWVHRDEDITNLAIQIFSREARGLNMKDEFKANSIVAQQVASSVHNIHEVILMFSDFFRTFFRTKNMPASVAYLPSSIRHCALMSDTDSTIFTTEYWCKWMNNGEIKVDAETNSYFATMVYFSSATLKHILAMMSANFGIETDRMFQIAMKNEFKFEVFVRTLKTKHYFSTISYQEGNVWEKIKQEVKGVHLQASDAPVEIIQDARKMMLDICNTIAEGKKLDVQKYLDRVAEVEREIYASVERGEVKYFKRSKIKDLAAYKAGPEQSNYQHYTFWNETFAKAYGESEPPPYGTFTVQTTLANKTELNNWINSIDHPEFRNALIQYYKRKGKTDHKTIYVPMSLFLNRPLPRELIRVVNTRAMISSICKSYYIILECLGVYRMNKKHTKLISDEY